MSLIEIRDVHKWYGEFHVLKGISERVEKGEVLVICGPSGSGKSSLIRCLNRLEPIQKGDILFEGTSIYAPEVDVNALRAEVGMVFQQFNLYPHLTVLENVTLAPIKVRGMGKKEATDLAMELLGRVGIARQAAKRPSEISGGQQQRVAIARSLAMQPRAMLFDEPTSAVLLRREKFHHVHPPLYRPDHFRGRHAPRQHGNMIHQTVVHNLRIKPRAHDKFRSRVERPLHLFHVDDGSRAHQHLRAGLLHQTDGSLGRRCPEGYLCAGKSPACQRLCQRSRVIRVFQDHHGNHLVLLNSL